MVTEIVTLMNAVNSNSQTLRTIAVDPLIPRDQKQLIETRIADNNEVIKAISEKIGKEPINA